MSPTKRAFPFLLWLEAFLILPLLFLPGLFFIGKEGVPVFSVPDFSLLLNAASLNALVPGLEKALTATLLCLLAGYPLGCLLALWRRRSALLALATPLFLLLGAAFIHGRRLIPLFPQGYAPVSLFSSAPSPEASIAIALLPLMVLCTAAFVSAVDPTLSRAARCLGASRLRACAACVFPRTLPGAAAGCLTVFLPALGLFAVSEPDLGISSALMLPLSAVLLILTFILITVCHHQLKKARSVSPC